jgi:hypothetical protein
MTQEAVAPPVLRDANQFDVAGPIIISYSRTSITGKPLLVYRDAELDLNFSGAEITRTPTPVGELVTITLEEVVDAFVRRFTLVVPTIRIQSAASVEFSTFGFETIDRSVAFVPAPGPRGVLQHHRIHQLRGTAQAIDF